MECYSLFSGSSGNCLYVREGKTEILVDAGLNCKRIAQDLLSVGSDLSRISAILITHEHVDHVAALPVLLCAKPMPVYCQEKVAKELYFGYQMRNKSKWAEVFARCVRTVEEESEYQVGDLVFAPFKTPHDSADSEGFVFQEGELGVATDLGHISSAVRRALMGCKNVVLESNHDLEMLWNGTYPYPLKERVASDNGHLNNFDSASFSAELLQAGCRNFTLFHLSAENNTPELALAAYDEAFRKIGASVGCDCSVRTASRWEVTKVL